MAKQKKASIIEVPTTPSANDLAVRLLHVQQRIDALDRLYNEEVALLRKDVSEINIAVIRQAQAQGRIEPQSGPAPPESTEGPIDEDEG